MIHGTIFYRINFVNSRVGFCNFKTRVLLESNKLTFSKQHPGREHLADSVKLFMFSRFVYFSFGSGAAVWPTLAEVREQCNKPGLTYPPPQNLTIFMSNKLLSYLEQIESSER